MSPANACRKVLAMATCILLLSFSSNPGGEGFEIYLNSNVVVAKFGRDMNSIQTLTLDKAMPNDEISVKYYHCGRMGKNRTILIKDEKDKLLKQWKFSDDGSTPDRMSCKVSEIMGLQKGKSGTLKLYYLSNELTKERQLASLHVGAKSVARL